MYRLQIGLYYNPNRSRWVEPISRNIETHSRPFLVTQDSYQAWGSELS